MSDFTELAEQYIAAWNETDPSARRALISEIWSEDGRYIDPLAEVAGRDQIDAVIAAAQAQFAGMTFRLAGPVDAHHDQARFTWELGPDGGEAGCRPLTRPAWPAKRSAAVPAISIVRGQMKRREFITLFGASTAWPLALRLWDFSARARPKATANSLRPFARASLIIGRARHQGLPGR